MNSLFEKETLMETKAMIRDLTSVIAQLYHEEMDHRANMNLLFNKLYSILNHDKERNS
jgi:hypothetical protein